MDEPRGRRAAVHRPLAAARAAIGGYGRRGTSSVDLAAFPTYAQLLKLSHGGYVQIVFKLRVDPSRIELTQRSTLGSSKSPGPITAACGTHGNQLL